MSFVITRLCRDCVDGACVDVCPTDCIVAHRAAPGEEELPRQLYIDPTDCISCNLCAPECPWEAIFDEADVPAAFQADVALNALSANRERGFHVPVERLHARPSLEEVQANWARFGVPRGG
jgi:ferredoxin